MVLEMVKAEIKMGIENEYENKIVLVTGGAGCVGSNLTRKIAELNEEKVIIPDNADVVIDGESHMMDVTFLIPA